MRFGLIGYDTVHLWLAAEDVVGGIPTEIVSAALQNLEHRGKQDTEEMYSVGFLDGLKVAVFASGISVKGSLGKYYAKADYGLLPSNQAESCIKCLSEQLGVPMEKAKITRLDVACDFVVQHLPKAYYGYLGESGSMEREQIRESLYYSITTRQLVFYDKAKEMKGKIPVIFKGRHVLRIELRLLKNLSQQLNIAQVSGSTLADQQVFHTLVSQWYHNYKKILKKREISARPGYLSTPVELEKHLLVQQIEEVGGIHEVLKMYDRYQLEHSWCKRTTNRYKKKMRKLAQHPNLTYESKLVQELDALVRQAAAEVQEELQDDDQSGKIK